MNVAYRSLRYLALFLGAATREIWDPRKTKGERKHCQQGAEGAAIAAGKGGRRRTERGKRREKESGDGTREGGRDHEDQEK